MIEKQMKNEKGFTLIEVLIAMTIGIALLGTAVYTYTKQDKIIRTGNRETVTRGMVRLALDKMVTEMRRAGYGTSPGDSVAGRPAWGISAASATSITYRANTDNVMTNVSVDCGDNPGSNLPPWYLFVEDNAGFAAGDNISVFSTRDLSDSETLTLTLVANYNGPAAAICTDSPANINSNYLLWIGGATNQYMPIEDAAAVVIHKYHTITYTYNTGTQIITVTDDQGTFTTGDDTTVTIANNVTAMTLRYHDASGTALVFPLSVADLGNIRRIHIAVTVQNQDDNTITDTLGTDVHLRNMGV